MIKKQRGPKASYLIYGGKPVQVMVEGRVVGISWDKGSRSYYTMLPDAETGRTKKKNLGRDKDKAVIKFRKITDALLNKEAYHDILSSKTHRAKRMFVQQSKNQTIIDFDNNLEELKVSLPKQDDETLEEQATLRFFGRSVARVEAFATSCRLDTNCKGQHRHVLRS